MIDRAAGGEFATDFYSSALSERGFSLRIDLLLAYDLDQLREVWDGEGNLHDCKFGNPDEKQAALLGVVSILGDEERSR